MTVCENPPFGIRSQAAKRLKFMVSEVDFSVSGIILPASLHRIKRTNKSLLAIAASFLVFVVFLLIHRF
jgi:predicted RNA methylase